MDENSTVACLTTWLCFLEPIYIAGCGLHLYFQFCGKLGGGDRKFPQILKPNSLKCVAHSRNKGKALTQNNGRQERAPESCPLSCALAVARVHLCSLPPPLSLALSLTHNDRKSVCIWILHGDGFNNDISLEYLIWPYSPLSSSIVPLLPPSSPLLHPKESP